MPGFSTKIQSMEVVLTGMSGRLPESDSIQEFAEQLFAGIDVVTEDDRRWTPGLQGLPKRNGKLKDLKRFDATFFGVKDKQAHYIDPQVRMLLELTHEAIVDAGFNPGELRGSRTGVYVGASYSETEEMWSADPNKISGYLTTGCHLTMFSNRISYAFDFTGPSFTLDTGCSSSLSAMVQAVAAMRAGLCDAAIVGGTNLCLKPSTTFKYQHLGLLSEEGRCATFDASCRGMVRSEAAVVVLLQRRSNARRIYATVRGARMNHDGGKKKSITCPSGTMQRQLARETLAEADLRTQDIVYVETHGTGTKIGDPQEVNAIADLFCEDRSTPLLIGGVKSNMGHSEPASGLCSIIKVVLAMERGELPGNLHYSTPNPDIPALFDGRIQVVAKNTKWKGGPVAINSFGLGGSNAHVILESHLGLRPAPIKYAVPRLLVASGRTEGAVRALLALGAQHAADAELHALLDAVHAEEIPKHPFRGFCLLDGKEMSNEEILEVSSERRPVWWIFPGVGSQCAGVSQRLMTLPVFAASIQRSAAALKPHNLDLVHMLTEAPKTAFDDVINSCVSITAVQVALVDVLHTLKILPDGIVGTSVGQIAGAYADGALTGEQAILCSYWRARSVVGAKTPPAAEPTAAVGHSWKCMASALHNNVVSPVSDVENIANLCDDAPGFVYNLLNEWSFDDALKEVPAHAILIELGPGAVMHSLQRTMPQAKMVPLLGNEDTDSIHHLLAAIGKLYTYGAQPQVSQLYPTVPWPVSRGTPGLASAVHWDHSAEWDVARFDETETGCSSAKNGAGIVFEVDLRSEEYAFLADHNIDGKIIFPTSGYFMLVWRSMAKLLQRRPEETPIVLENLEIRRATVLRSDVTTRFLVSILQGSGLFEVLEVCEVVVTGTVRVLINATVEQLQLPIYAKNTLPKDYSNSINAQPKHIDSTKNTIFTDDVYKKLRLRGYNYGGVFRNIRALDADGTYGSVFWSNNWISFMDALLQVKFYFAGVSARDLRQPTRVQRALIDPTAQAHALDQRVDSDDSSLSVHYLSDIDVVVSDGLEFHGVQVGSVNEFLKGGKKEVSSCKESLNAPTTGAMVLASKHNATPAACDNLVQKVVNGMMSQSPL